jgi:hypothetical protein
MSFVGVDYLTYFCGPLHAVEIARIIGTPVNRALPEHWEPQVFVVDGRTIRVSHKAFAPASEFSSIVLGLQAALRKAEILSSDGVERALDVILACDVMVGTVFDPPVDEGDTRAEIAAQWAGELDAVVFDGWQVLSSSLEVIARVRI